VQSLPSYLLVGQPEGLVARPLRHLLQFRRRRLRPHMAMTERATMPTDIHPKLFRAFVAVAGERSFFKAAGRLSVSQGTVSTRVAQLEGILGAQLLERRRGRHGGIALTREGCETLADAKKLLALQDRIVLRSRSRNKPYW